MRIQYLGLIASVLLLAACQTPAGDGSDAGRDGRTGSMTSKLSPADMKAAEQKLNYEIGDRVLFGYDRYDLTADARETLDKQVSWMNQYKGLAITVEGHADERGTREYNLALGERRANAVKNYMVAMGVNADRIATISYGKERPEETGSNEEAWRKNRRAVTAINK